MEETSRTRSYAAIFWAALAVLLLGGLYVGLKASLSGRVTEAPRSRTYHLSISARRFVGELPVLMATRGDTVTLVIRSDRTGELHVHDREEKKVDLVPGGEVSLKFLAKDAGHFAIHLHDADGSMHGLAMLEVQPR